MSFETLKRYFWAWFGAVAVIAFWAGIWDGPGYLPYLENPWISLGVGAIMLISSGYLFKEFDPLEEMEQNVVTMARKVHKHQKKHEFHFKFHDHLLKKDILYEAKHLKAIEKGFLVFVGKEGKEIFVPAHRIKEVLHKMNSYWKHGDKL